MDNPTGTGKLEITNISIGPNSTSIDFEGQVDGYGTVFASHILQSIDGDRERGTTTGEARTFLLDGSFLRPLTAAHLLGRAPYCRSISQTRSIMAP